uniref:Uncharacterized protein n=1 Tax=Rhizophora mucronata TaxID=61149 RepID=A0A2P2QZB9_RHIMU
MPIIIASQFLTAKLVSCSCSKKKHI